MKRHIHILIGLATLWIVIILSMLFINGRENLKESDNSIASSIPPLSYHAEQKNLSGSMSRPVSAGVSIGKTLKLYQNDGTTLIGYFLGYDSQDFISPLPACQRLTYSTIGTGTVNVAGLYGCQGNPSSSLWFPNTTCAGSTVYTNAFYAPSNVLVQSSTGAWLTSANNGSNMIHGYGTYTYSRYSGGSCMTGSVTFADTGGMSANGSQYALISSLCGGGPCVVK